MRIVFARWSMLCTVLVIIASDAAGSLPDCYVLAVGVENYPNDTLKLFGCLNDARNTANIFAVQAGKNFGKVSVVTLLDNKADHASIGQQLRDLKKMGKAEDIFVLFFSGHGVRGKKGRGWAFLPYDYAKNKVSVLTDKQLLDAADAVIGQGKKVIIIVDACNAGELRQSAQAYLKRYQKGTGGLVLLLSSSAEQASSAADQYSGAFARAFSEGLAGAGDSDGDGTVTLDEINDFAHKRTHQLLKQKNKTNQQDTEGAWSASVAGSLVLATVDKLPPGEADARVPSLWSGNEVLDGSNSPIALQMLPGGSVFLTAKEGVFRGRWQKNDRKITLTFDDGMKYVGTWEDRNLFGAAEQGDKSWSWSVKVLAGR